MVGVVIGRGLLSHIGINNSLWFFGLFQAGNVALAQAGHSYPMKIATINFEYFSAGLGTARFVAFLMSLCNHRFTATQYALLSSLMAVSWDVMASPSGMIAETIGCHSSSYSASSSHCQPWRYYQ